MANPSSEKFFEQKYAAHADPWAFASSRYEISRYETIIRAICNRRYQRAFEPGCSVGILTGALAKFCDRIEAIDISASAAARAQKHCAGLDNVRITHGKLPEATPLGSFDLIVFSEIGYYFAPDALVKVASQLVEHLHCGGVFLAAHWLGLSADHELHGDEVHMLLGTVPKIERTLTERQEGFRLERWARV